MTNVDICADTDTGTGPLESSLMAKADTADDGEIADAEEITMFGINVPAEDLD